MIEFLQTVFLEPLNWAFFQRGLAAGFVAALVCGTLGVFVVWRGMSFLGDALAHAILPGTVTALALGINPLVGALTAGAAAAFGIAGIGGRRGIREDSAIGIVFTGAFALGIILMGKLPSTQDPTHLLFGSILAVSVEDLVLIFVLGVIVLAVVVAMARQFVIVSTDPVFAEASGVKVQRVRFALLLVLAAATVITAHTVGVVLAIALLVSPATAAFLVTRRLHIVMALSLVFAFVAVVVGFYLSWWFDLATGAAIVVVLSVIFALCFLKSRLAGRVGAGKNAATVAAQQKE